jgi:hypothetical protein
MLPGGSAADRGWSDTGAQSATLERQRQTCDGATEIAGRVLLALPDSVDRQPHYRRLANRFIRSSLRQRGPLAASPPLKALVRRYFEDCNETHEAMKRAKDVTGGCTASAVDPGSAGRLWDVGAELAATVAGSPINSDAGRLDGRKSCARLWWQERSPR